MPTITVTVEGPQTAGKTRLADILQHAIHKDGATVIDASVPNSVVWQYLDSEIRIVEKQVD